MNLKVEAGSDDDIIDQHSQREFLVAKAPTFASTLALVLVGGCFDLTPACAQDATWSGGGSDWATATNWSPASVPINAATFANNGAPTAVNIAPGTGATIEVLHFTADAPNYTITTTGSQTTGDGYLGITGTGIVNNASGAPNLVAGFQAGPSPTTGLFYFANTATAGNADIILNGCRFCGAGATGAAVEFRDSSTAGNSVIADNGGQVSFSPFGGSSTAAHSTITVGSAIPGGTVLFESSSTAGNATITIRKNGDLIFLNSSTGGDAKITNNAGVGGVMLFLNNSTGGNAKLINKEDSTIDFSHTTGPNSDGKITAGSIEGAGTFKLGSNVLTVGGNNHSTVVSGKILDDGSGGALIKTGTGTLTLSGNDAYSGGTTINEGTLTIGNNAALGTGTLTMAQGTTLGFLNTGNFTIANPITMTGDPNFTPPLGTTQSISGVISDGATPGTLNMNGAGTLILNATNTYTGPTDVTSGTLTVNGSIATSSLTTASSGATLNGTGTVGSLLIASGGTFVPGSGAPGTFTTVAGSLTLATASTYQEFLNPATASFASVSGTATLGGATVNATFASSNYISRQYTILTAGNISGTFGGLTNTNLPANFSDTLSYDSTHAYLDLTLNFTPPSAPVYSPLNINQSNVANTLVNYFNTTGGIPTAFGTLSAAQLSQVDGEANADAQKGAFQLMSDFLNLMLDPSSGGGIGGGGGGSNSGALGFAPEQDTTLPPKIVLAYGSMLTKASPKPRTFDQRWIAWGSAFGGTSHTNGDPAVGSNNVTANDYGFAGGLNYHLSPDTILGFALAGGGINWNLAQGLGGGRSDAFQGGVYAKTHNGPAYLSAALAFANNWFTTNRTSALGDQLQAKFQGQSYGGRLEAGFRYGLRSTNSLAGITPYAALQAQSFHTPNYTETDLTGGGFGLAFNAMNATDTRSELGMRADDLTMLGAMPLILRGRLAWAHDWISNPALAAAFQTLPGTNFIANGAAPPKDSALTAVAAELRMTTNWSLLGKFDSQFGNGSQIYAGTGTLRYSW